tara:strand:+ start:176 stop:634 length:459 start_codon:yes stop_codon:yes gene_type:complete
MTIEGEASLPPSTTTIVYANQKSGGPRVFGAIAVVFGILGIVSNLQVMSSVSEEPLALVFFGLGAVANGLFIWAGVLLWQYKKKGVWVGFGSVAVSSLTWALPFILLEAAFSGEAGGIIASIGIFIAGINAVCCGLVVALPLLMNGNDLDDD